MPKNPTIAANNVFCIARKQAASFNDNLNSREGASEELGIDRTRLARIELGSLNPYPEEVLMMSDVYNAPEPVEIGDTVDIDTDRGVAKGIVSFIDVPEAEIAPFKDRAKTIIGKAQIKEEEAAANEQQDK